MDIRDYVANIVKDRLACYMLQPALNVAQTHRSKVSVRLEAKVAEDTSTAYGRMNLILVAVIAIAE